MSIRLAGVINNYTVIEAAGRTLAELLMTEMEDPVPVTIASPGEDYGVPVAANGVELGTSRVNLFLYRVEEPSHSRNNDWVNAGEGRQIPFPLNLNLYYIVNIFTPDKSSNLDEHRILGDVMQVFHSNPNIDPIFFEGTLNPNESPVGLPCEELKIILHPLPLEDLAAVWNAISKPYRLSVAYEVSVVMIKPPSHKSRRIRRVDSTHVKANTFKGRPLLREISPSHGFAGDLITISGERFDSAFLKVFFNDRLISPSSKDMSEITFNVPDNSPPGLYSIKVSSIEGYSKEIAFEEISPFLFRLEPDMKYTEDTSFPKNSSSEPILTIWGGNFLTDPPTSIEIMATPDGGTMSVFSVIPEQVSNNSIKWVIPTAMREGRTTVKVQQDGVRISNVLLLEIPTPQIYRVDPEVISELPGKLIIVGDYFRSGATDLYVHKGPLSNITDLVDSEIVTIVYKSETEIRTTLLSGLANDVYQLVVRVHGKYHSEPYEIRIEA